MGYESPVFCSYCTKKDAQPYVVERINSEWIQAMLKYHERVTRKCDRCGHECNVAMSRRDMEMIIEDHREELQEMNWKHKRQYMGERIDRYGL